jgi:hypothetical protein
MSSSGAALIDDLRGLKYGLSERHIAVLDNQRRLKGVIRRNRWDFIEFLAHLELLVLNRELLKHLVRIFASFVFQRGSVFQAFYLRIEIRAVYGHVLGVILIAQV